MWSCRWATRGQLKSTTMSKNSRNWYYLAAPVLAQLQKGMVNKWNRKRMCIVKLLDILKSHELGLENKQYHHIKNFVTRKLFPQDAWQQIVDCEKNEDKIYDQMIKERLQFDSTTEVITRAKSCNSSISLCVAVDGFRMLHLFQDRTDKNRCWFSDCSLFMGG